MNAEKGKKPYRGGRKYLKMNLAVFLDNKNFCLLLLYFDIIYIYCKMIDRRATIRVIKRKLTEKTKEPLLF